MESELPGVVAMCPESELESESINLPRLRLQIVHYNLTQFGLGKDNFLMKFSGNHCFLNFPRKHLHTMKDDNLKSSVSQVGIGVGSRFMLMWSAYVHWQLWFNIHDVTI